MEILHDPESAEKEKGEVIISCSEDKVLMP